MTIIKKYYDNKSICHVTFMLPEEISENFEQASLVGDFNNWDTHKDKFSHKGLNGLLRAEIDLEAGKGYQFRYLGNGETWLNEPEADKQVLTHFGDSESSVLII